TRAAASSVQVSRLLRLHREIDQDRGVGHVVVEGRTAAKGRRHIHIDGARVHVAIADSDARVLVEGKVDAGTKLEGEGVVLTFHPGRQTDFAVRETNAGTDVRGKAAVHREVVPNVGH